MYPKEQVIAIPEPAAERIMKGRQGKELPSAGQIKVWLTGNMNWKMHLDIMLHLMTLSKAP